MSEKKIDTDIKKLVLIKYLYTIANEQSQQLGASAGFSILSFHDCVEMLLVLIARQEDIRSQKKSFIEYWREIPNLPYMGEMDNLNNVRVGLKHHATFPNPDEIARCREDVKLFLTTCVDQYFKVDFDTLSLASLITYDEVKKMIEEAEQYIKDESVYEALLKCKLAFIKLITIYDSDKKQWFKSILDVGENIDDGYKSLLKNNKEAELWFKNMTNTTNAIRNTLKITSLGIDYKRYAFFNFITPKLLYSRSPLGEEIYIPDSKTTFESEKSVKLDDCRFCVEFVVDSALKLQGLQYNLEQYKKTP